MATWTSVTFAAPNNLLRKYKCKDADNAVRAGLQGVDEMTGTAVEVFHLQLLLIGLPFRVTLHDQPLRRLQSPCDAHLPPLLGELWDG